MGKVLGRGELYASASASISSSSSPDILVAQESIQALAIISVCFVTFHSVELHETPAASVDVDSRDRECRRLFAETLAEGGLISLLHS